MILFFLPTILTAQSKFDTVSFEIKRKNKVIGQVSATRIANGAIELYKVDGNIDKGTLLVNTMKYKLYVEYRYGKLYKSDLKIFVNNQLHKDTQIISNGNNYVTTIKGGRKKEFKKPITFSSVQLLFRAPNRVKKTFSEGKLRYREIFQDDKNKNSYSLGDSASHIDCYYQYDQGRLVLIQIRDIVDFDLVEK